MRTTPLFFLAAVLSAPIAYSAPTTQPITQVGEQIPSEDSIIKNLHSLGLLEGRTNIFRSASPVRDLAKEMTTTQPTDDQLFEARARMQHIYDLGIRTVISLQDAKKEKGDDRTIVLEQEAAEQVGLRFINDPMANSGPNSLETMSDAQTLAWLNSVTADIFKYSSDGGVLYHCSAGHDRTGIVSAYIRMKYQGWPVDEAIAEMRRLGHNWPKFSANGGVSSWHEEHLRAIAQMLADEPTTRGTPRG